MIRFQWAMIVVAAFRGAAGEPELPPGDDDPDKPDLRTMTWVEDQRSQQATLREIQISETTPSLPLEAYRQHPLRPLVPQPVSDQLPSGEPVPSAAQAKLSLRTQQTQPGTLPKVSQSTEQHETSEQGSNQHRAENIPPSYSRKE